MRQPEPWYRTSKSAWYVQVGGRKVRLAKGPKNETRKAAFDAFYKLMATRPNQAALDSYDLIFQYRDSRWIRLKP